MILVEWFNYCFSYFLIISLAIAVTQQAVLADDYHFDRESIDLNLSNGKLNEFF